MLAKRYINIRETSTSISESTMTHTKEHTKRVGGHSNNIQIVGENSEI